LSYAYLSAIDKVFDGIIHYGRWDVDLSEQEEFIVADMRKQISDQDPLHDLKLYLIDNYSQDALKNMEALGRMLAMLAAYPCSETSLQNYVIDGWGERVGVEMSQRNVQFITGTREDCLRFLNDFIDVFPLPVQLAEVTAPDALEIKYEKVPGLEPTAAWVKREGTTDEQWGLVKTGAVIGMESVWGQPDPDFVARRIEQDDALGYGILYISDLQDVSADSQMPAIIDILGEARRLGPDFYHGRILPTHWIVVISADPTPETIRAINEIIQYPIDTFRMTPISRNSDII